MLENELSKAKTIMDAAIRLDSVEGEISEMEPYEWGFRPIALQLVDADFPNGRNGQVSFQFLNLVCMRARIAADCKEFHHGAKILKKVIALSSETIINLSCILEPLIENYVVEYQKVIYDCANTCGMPPWRGKNRRGMENFAWG